MSASMFMNFRILIITWICITGCYTQNDTLDVAVVEDNLPDNQEEDPSMPPKLNMTINLFQNDTNVVDLKLGMNTALNEQRSIYVIRTNKAGQPVIKKQQIPIEGNIAFYQDKTTGANVMLTCDGFEVGHCDPVLEGSFYVKNIEYGLQPLSMDSPLRRKRSANGRRGKLYSVFRRTQDKPVKDDFQMNPESVNTGTNGQSMQLVDRVLDLSEFMNPSSATMELRRRVSDTDTKTRQRKPRKRINISSTQYQMGLIVIIDFSIYQTWYRRSDEATAVERDIDAKSKIRQYMAHVINGVDLRFQNLRRNRIKIVVSRYIIADTPGASPWTSRRFIAQPRDLVYADDALNELIKWRYRMGHELPIHDHTILFTGYDLYRPTLANKGVAGFARVRSMCSHSSVSVVEEHGGFGSILTATHEIGHSLGAYHDGHNNSCAGEDNFIMTPIGGSATPSNALNPFHFSECSEDAFDNLIDALPRSHCLTDETDTYDQEEFESYLTQKAGQLYGPNQQCRQHLGSESYYAWGGILGEATEVCTHMACKNAMSNTSFNIYYAAQGTSCGNKKWCVDGECLYEEKAPKREETCVHGDAWRRFGGLTCAQYVNADPSRCYYSYYSRFCCVSCASLRKGEPGCEYGNRKKKVCNMVDRDPRFCYHDNNENLCCGSCKKHNTGITGCEYGDRLPECNTTKCDDNTYAKQCCKTCSEHKRKPKPLALVSPMRESVSATITVLPKKRKSNRDGTFTSVPLPPNALSSRKTEIPLTLPVLTPESSMSENNTIQDSLRSTLHKVEGIEVSQHGPIKPLTTQMDTFNQPVVGQTQKSAFHHSRDWKSRQSTIPRKTLISKPVVVMNNNERRPTVFHSNETRPVKMFSTSEIESNNRINSVFSQNVPSPSNDVHSPLGDIRSINMLKTSSVTKQQLEQEQLKKRKQQELEKQRREQQERDRKQDAKKQEEYRLEQERLQLQREKEQREQRNREQQQREQRQREQQQREQRQREQQREQRQREQQQREQRQREQQQREQRQREQQQREQRQREQQQREQLNQRERLQRQRQLQSQNPTRHHSSTQLLVRPSHQSTPPRIFHVNRFPAMSRSTNVLNKLRRNSLRPRVTTTTTTTTTPAPVRVAPPILFSNPHQEQCVKPGAVFMSLKCDWLVRLMKGLCKNPILGRVCCADCKPVQPREPVCVDDIGCILTHSAQCYDRSKRSKCCATCKAFKTEHQGCEYGDRERHCDLFLQYMPDYTCDSFRNSCCLSCKSRIETTTVPPIEVMTTATWSENAWDHSFNTRQTFHHNDRNAMFNENPDVLHWNK